MLDIINNTSKLLGDDLKNEIKSGSKLRIAASCFSIYAYSALKAELEKIDELKFLFTTPTFVEEQVSDNIKHERREFYIPKGLCGTDFEIRLKNQMTQKAIARECAEWIRNKVKIKTLKEPVATQSMINIDFGNKCVHYTPVNGFTTADLGYEKNNSNLVGIVKTDMAEQSKFFIDKPTNLIVQLDQNLTEEDFVKYLFQVEMLQEVSEISAKTAKTQVKRAFRSFISKAPIKDGEYAGNIYKCKSVVLLATRLVIQAIGRICRTNMKSKNIYIFADSRIADYIDSSVTEGRNYNCEFIELLDAISSQNLNIEEGSLEEAASLKSVRVNRFINSMMPNKGMNEDWTDERIERWQQLRELVLISPTMSKAEVDKNFIAYNFYVQLPTRGNALYYSEEKDFNNITVSFRKSHLTEQCISAEAAKLTDLMRIDFLRKYFENHGWATCFEPNDFIMAPPLFNNIYRGALGEVVGKAIFYRYANVPLEDITENKIFEFFDYKVPDVAVYVDFKNWHETSNFDDEQMTAHIISKAKECKAKCVIIANILSDSRYQIRKKTIEGIELLILPSLLLQDKENSVNKAAWDEIRRCVCEYAD